jgi:CheY-like chemotaxis protein
MRYDLVITDLSMPAMSGVDMARQLREMGDEIPIVLMTGYELNVTDEMRQSCGIDCVLGKPLELVELAAVIRATLDA